ncbi:MAG: hypothetical protein ACW98X_04980 [Promethearchaeota archaeon]|jgi:uncharacterized membrane protein (DUF373 family)
MATRSLLEEKYMKIFAIGMVFLIGGIIILMISRIYTTFAEYNTMAEMEALFKVRGLLSAFILLFLTLGIVLFAFSTFMGGVVDDAISSEIRRGMVFASSMAIVALALILIFSGLIMV